MAVYTRISTEQDGQKNSLENQKSYFLQMINSHTDWELFGIYADEGVSGTGVAGRAAFLEMLCQARQKKFDLILTKEVSRFARNTVDTLSITRELRALGIRVLFVNDSIDTYSGDGEFRLAIMASVAQEESRKTSERVRFGIYRQMEQGYVFGRTVYGYDLKKGVLYVNEAQAAVVRQIFSMAASGQNCEQIAAVLEREHAPLGRYMKAWRGHTVRKILRNEKYRGDLIQRKSYVVDYLTHRAKENRGEVPQIMQQDHHAPLVTSALFALANEKTRKEREKSVKMRCESCGGLLKNKGKSKNETTRFYCPACKKTVYFTMGQKPKEVHRYVPTHTP